jgi:hypothetical protein
MADCVSYSAGDCGSSSSFGDSGTSHCYTSHHAGDGGTSHTSHNAGDSGIYSITADSGTTYYGSTPEEVAERERKGKERQEKKQQRREARAEVANTIKAKRNETTKKSEKIRLAVTWLTLKLHL